MNPRSGYPQIAQKDADRKFQSVKSAKSADEIMLFMAPGCPRCHAAAGDLRRLGIGFRAVDTTTPEGLAEFCFYECGGLELPQFYFNGGTYGTVEALVEALGESAVESGGVGAGSGGASGAERDGLGGDRGDGGGGGVVDL